MERIEDLLELKMNMKRKIPLKRVVRQKGSNSNAPPLIVTFEEQVSTIQCVNMLFRLIITSFESTIRSFKTQGDRDEVLRLFCVMKHSGFTITEPGASPPSKSGGLHSSKSGGLQSSKSGTNSDSSSSSRRSSLLGDRGPPPGSKPQSPTKRWLKIYHTPKLQLEV